MTPESLASDSLLLTPGETYEQRLEQVSAAETQVRACIRNHKRVVIESLITWLIMIFIAWKTQETIAALTTVGWLFFVGWYYMPSASKALLSAREHLRIRVAYLTVEDAEIFLKAAPSNSLVSEMIQYRKKLVPLPI
ncbi:hypothetical protein IFT48_02190 [Pseudomonas fluorescens]|uniref:hypothetical protein n=1 Tax=Pseudomonas fluorescens TaxID=294 RepID=UPI001930A8FA|nr:hypothetical protein [Pseudomonas fluorescens]MBD8088773.1 hypothetical protein [Pseudomonas fluorescens]